MAAAETQPVICPAYPPPLPSAFSLSNRYGLISMIRGAMQVPKGTAGNSGSNAEHKTKIGHFHSFPPA